MSTLIVIVVALVAYAGMGFAIGKVVSLDSELAADDKLIGTAAVFWPVSVVVLLILFVGNFASEILPSWMGSIGKKIRKSPKEEVVNGPLPV